MTYRRRVGYLRNGEPVSAPVTNRPIADVANNLDAVREQVDLLASGSKTVLLDVTLDAACLVGSPVVFDGEQFVPAELDPDSGLFRADGIVRAKKTATTGDLTLAGADQIDLSAVVDSDDLGLYYLSGTPGRLTATPPAWPVPVLTRTSTAGVIVFGPSQASAGASHEHKVLYLDHHRSTGDEAGWQEAVGLPGQPTGALYRYENSTAVDQMAARYVNGSSWTVTEFNGYGRGNDLDDTVVVLNRHGLWWLAADIAAGDPSGSASSAAGGPMRLRLASFLSPYSTVGVVRSLVSADPDGPVQVTNCDGTGEPTGNLQVGWDASKATGASDRAGYRPFKAFVNGRLVSGPVLEGLIPADSSIVLTGTTAKTDPDDSSSDDMYVGQVTIRADLNPDGRVVLPQTVRVDDLRQRTLAGLYYLAMPADRTSAGVYKLRLPGPDALGGSSRLTFSVLLYAEVTGTLPALTVRYKQLPRPAAGSGDTPPGAYTSLTFSSALAVTAGNYYRVDSATISPVAAGDVFVFEIARAAPDGYAGEVGLLDVVGVLDTP